MGRRKAPAAPVGQGMLIFGADDPAAVPRPTRADLSPATPISPTDDPFADHPPSDPLSPPTPAPAPPRPSPSTPLNGNGAASRPPKDSAFLDGETIRRAFGLELRSMLDLASWDQNPDPGEMIHSITERARRVVQRDRDRREPLRKLVEEQIFTTNDRPQWVGFHPVHEEELREVARTILYNGSTEAVCGDYVVHNTVPLAIAQAGICVVGYSGRQSQWHQRIIRREWEIELDDPVAEVEALFQQRDLLSHPGYPNHMEMLNQLARRGVVSYMERLVMLQQCPGKWRLGDGVPIPLDLLTGAANMELLEMSLDLLRDLLLGDPRWAFVSHTAREPGLQMIGDALGPMEFAILIRLHPRLKEQVDHGHYLPRYGEMARRFVDDVGRHVVMGVFRAGLCSPPWFFFAHEERAYEAALILMADALALQPHGFPPLLRLARTSCHTALGGEAFHQLIQQAYRDAGGPEYVLRGAIS